MEDVFEVALKWLKAYRYDKFTPDFYTKFYSEIAKMLLNDVVVTESFMEIRDWLYDRLDKDFNIQRTGYLNEHAVVTALWGAIRLYDSLYEELFKSFLQEGQTQQLTLRIEDY